MPKGRKPTFNACVKIGDRWQTIGAAWALEEQEGFSLKLETLPVKFDGRITLFPYKEKEE